MSENDSIEDVQSLMTALAATRAKLAEADSPGIPDDGATDTPGEFPPEVQVLRSQQRVAVEELIAGSTHGEAAQAAGVDRRTLYRWMNHEPAFRAALEACRRRAISSAEEHLTQATQMAADTLTRAASRDFRAAALLLRGRGLLPGPRRQAKSASTQVVELPVEAVPAGKLRDFEVRLRELILSLRQNPDAAFLPEQENATEPAIEAPAVSRAEF